MPHESTFNKELCKKYPFLLPYNALAQQDTFELVTDKVDQSYKYDFTMLDFVPDGWSNLFLEMCEELSAAIKGKENEKTFRFEEIKEKWGELRMYTAGTSEETEKIIEEYTIKSRKVCIRCGAAATRISRGWISPYCDDCIGDSVSFPIDSSV
ncbi:MAG: hypothetical protein IJI14_07575 [Anaerolineaceae bacterium]|nr:hypothetical protein [Anaerolineaceae bacterium]